MPCASVLSTPRVHPLNHRPALTDHPYFGWLSATTLVVATAKITIPAVKIIGTAPTVPFLPEGLLAPDPCPSEDISPIEPVSSISALEPLGDLLPAPIDDDVAAVLSSNEEDVAEFGEFLLDAVDWL